MDASPLDAAVLTVTFAAIFFYVLHGVIRSAVPRGIEDARKRATTGADRPVDSARVE